MDIKMVHGEGKRLMRGGRERLSTRETSARKKPSLSLQRQDYWIHPAVSRNCSIQNVIPQKRHPDLDKMPSGKNKESKGKKQAQIAKRRKRVGGQYPTKQNTFSSSHIDPMKSLVSKLNQLHSSEEVILSPKTEEPLNLRLESDLQELQQPIPAQPLSESPPPAVPEFLKSEAIQPESSNTPMLYTTPDTFPFLVEKELQLDPSDPQADRSAPTESQTEAMQTAAPALHKKSIPLQENIFKTEATLKNDPVVYPNIVFKDQKNSSYVLVSLLYEIWDVNWEHPLHVIWGRKWSRLQYETHVDVKEICHDQNGSILWISGEILLTGVGTAQYDSRLLHETLSIPFTSTVLHPTFTASAEEKTHQKDFPVHHDEIWIRAGDWKAELFANPIRMEGSETQGYDGFIHITGRVWWFRKQLLSLAGVKKNDQS